MERGDIYLVSLDPVSGHEQQGERPVLVISPQAFNRITGIGMKHRVDNGVYIFYGSMNPQLAEKTGFSDQDAAALKEVLPKLFENDASSARPEGSMRVEKVFWWQHNCKSGQYSSAKVHGTVTLNSDGSYKEDRLPDLPPEIVDGF